jgi:tetratricopeptide (TPR) repeat protein
MLTMVSCGSIVRTEGIVVVESNPSGANVWMENEFLGQTPLEIKQATGSLNSLRVSHPGFYDSHLNFSSEKFQKVSVSLQKIDGEDFKKIVKQELPQEMNRMVNRLLEVHAKIISKQYQDAETEVNDLIKEYPSVAAPYTLKANILVHQGNIPEAYRNALMAVKLDNRDVTASRLVHYLEERMKR